MRICNRRQFSNVCPLRSVHVKIFCIFMCGLCGSHTCLRGMSVMHINCLAPFQEAWSQNIHPPPSAPTNSKPHRQADYSISSSSSCTVQGQHPCSKMISALHENSFSCCTVDYHIWLTQAVHLQLLMMCSKPALCCKTCWQMWSTAQMLRQPWLVY